MQSLNFEVLRKHYPELADLGELAERYVHSDPDGAVAKLRTYGEALTLVIFAHHGLPRSGATQFERLKTFHFESIVPDEVLRKFQAIRMIGNQGGHARNPAVTQEAAISRLRDAHDLARWWGVTELHCDIASLQQFRIPPPRAAASADVQKKLDEQALLLEKALADLEKATNQYKEVRRDDAELKVLKDRGEESAWLLRMMPDASGLSRGVQLFRYLAEQANRGKPTGISYGDFVAHVHGKGSFHQVAGRNYLPGDSGAVIRLAYAITEENKGRIAVTASGRTIQTGMDTFIWASRPPYDRPDRAWQNSKAPLPYSRADWDTVFPEGRRTLVKPGEIGSQV